MRISINKKIVYNNWSNYNRTREKIQSCLWNCCECSQSREIMCVWSGKVITRSARVVSKHNHRRDEALSSFYQMCKKGITVRFRSFLLPKEEKYEKGLAEWLLKVAFEKLELLVYKYIDFLQRRLYAEKQHRKCFEMRYREDVPFLEGAPAHARWNCYRSGTTFAFYE